MKAAKQFLKAVKPQTKSHQVNLTDHQVETIKNLQKVYDVSFEDCVNHASQEIHETYLKQNFNQGNRRN